MRSGSVTRSTPARAASHSASLIWAEAESDPLNTSSRKAHSIPASRPSRLRSQGSSFRALSSTGPKYSSSDPSLVASVWNFRASGKRERNPKNEALLVVPGGPTSSA